MVIFVLFYATAMSKCERRVFDWYDDSRNTNENNNNNIQSLILHSTPLLLNNADKKCWMCVWLSRMVTYTKTLDWRSAPYFRRRDRYRYALVCLNAFSHLFGVILRQWIHKPTIWVKKNTFCWKTKLLKMGWEKHKNQRKIAQEIDNFECRVRAKALSSTVIFTSSQCNQVECDQATNMC